MINYTKNYSWITILSILCLLLDSGLVSSEETEENLPENLRNERAILGGHNHNGIVGGGSPGKDFPTLSVVPRTNFNCQGRTPGYYADEEYGCQVFHICHSDRRKDSFLCPNGTIFHQLRLVCDWWYNVDCSTSDLHVSVNNDIGKTSPARNRQDHGRVSFTSQRKKVDLFQRVEKPTVTQTHFPPENDFGVPLRPISDFRGNTINDERDLQFIPRDDVAVHVQERFSNVIQPPQVFITTSPAPPVRSSFINNITPRTGVTLRTFSNIVTPRPGVTLRTFSNNVTPRLGVTLRTFSNFETPRSSQTLKPFTSNVTPRTGIPLPTVSNHFQPSFHTQRGQNRVTPAVGVELQTVSDHFNNFRGNNLNSINSNANLKIGQPLPPQNNVQTLPGSIVPPEHFTVPKPGVPLAGTNNLNNVNGRGSSRGRVSNARRILINKTPITNPIQTTATDPRTSSRTRSRIEQNFRDQNEFNNIGNDGGVVVLEDDRVATQFFNIGQPRRVVVNKQPISNNVGIPLPQINNQNSIRGRGNGRGSFGVPLQTSTLQPINRNNFRNDVGVALPAPNSPSNNNNNLNHFGIPLPQNLDNRNNIRTNTGRPLTSLNGISSGHNPVGTARGRIASTNQNNFASSQRSGGNVNRGSTTFFTSQRNSGRVNQLINSQLNRPTTTRNQQNEFIVVRDFDDDILDDLDDLNDPFDDDRFDDDRFDKDRFEVDDRFDDDRFDNDRFDLDDRLDDLKDKLEDKFDNDRFDLDDKFDSDRFDKDRFELDDRFDDIDDKLDDKLDDLFDFDDEIDDRRNRFGNDAGFNFGRRPRGSNFHVKEVKVEKTPAVEESKSSLSIEPPSEIQLPPPPL